MTNLPFLGKIEREEGPSGQCTGQIFNKKNLERQTPIGTRRTKNKTKPTKQTNTNRK